MLRAVLAALVDCLEFIERSPDHVIDPDAAVRAMEDVSARLATLSPSERTALIAELRELEIEADSGRREFIAGLPEALGLTA